MGELFEAGPFLVPVHLVTLGWVVAQPASNSRQARVKIRSSKRRLQREEFATVYGAAVLLLKTYPFSYNWHAFAPSV